MFTSNNYTQAHIMKIRERTKADPSIIERTFFAFGLLEAISKVGVPFIFKGGTSLMVLLSEPRRLSTDIDIIVEPETSCQWFFILFMIFFPYLPLSAPF